MKNFNKIGIVCLILISCALAVTMVSADTSGVLNPLTSASGSSGVLNPLTSASGSSGVLDPLTSAANSSGVLNPLTSTANSSGVLNPLTSAANSSGVLNPLTPASDSSGVLNPLTPASDSSGVLNPLTPASDSSGVLNPLTPASDSSGVLNPLTSGNGSVLNPESTNSSSTSTQDQSSTVSGQTPGTKDIYGGIITENRVHLAKEEYSQHLIRFDNYGQVTVQAQEGATFNLYSKKGESWPTLSTFKTDYDQTVKVTDKEPGVMNVGPGIWVFTIDSPDQGGLYSLSASQN